MEVIHCIRNFQDSVRISKGELSCMMYDYIKKRLTEYERTQMFKQYLTDTSFDELTGLACKVRNETVGNKLFVRASIELSNLCDNECAYCGMSKKNEKLSRYTLPEDLVKEVIDHISELGIKQVHIVAGEYSELDLDMLCNIVRYAKEQALHVTLVLGKREKEVYQRFYDAGAERYIMKFETSNEELFEKYKKSSLSERFDQLDILRGIGFKIGTGVIVDLPKTTLEDNIRDLEILNSIKPDMASASMFSPNSESELKGYIQNDITNTLRFIATLRATLRESTKMISCSSSLGEEGQYAALMAGANVISYHATPKDYINGFSSYRAKERVKTKMDTIERLAFRSGLELSEYV